MREPPEVPDVGMSEMGPHPGSELSAYVDDALDAAEHARIAAHLDRCGPCASRARELSATAALLRALPDPRPSRSLMPRLVRVPAWYVPARLFSGVASGAFALLFVAAALGALGAPRSSTTAAAPAAAPTELAPGRGAGAAPAASARSDGAQKQDQAASASPPAFNESRPALPSAVALPGGPAPTSQQPAPAGPAPLLWLGLALASGATAALFHVRMRAR